MSMSVEVLGKRYTLELHYSGQIWEKENDIMGPDVDTVVKLLRAHIKAEKNAPRIKVLTFGDRWSRDERLEYYEGTVSAAPPKDRTGSKWLSYRKAGKVTRCITYYYWEDTPENRARLDRIIELRKEQQRMEREEKQLYEQLTRPTL